MRNGRGAVVGRMLVRTGVPGSHDTGEPPWQPAQDHGSMYGTSFTDSDGHVWETMWMDPSAVQ